jgi:Protein of unknown function (DUF1236)
MKFVPMLSAAMLALALALSGAYAQSLGSEQGAGGPSASPPSMAPSQGAGGSPDMGPSGRPAGAMQEGQAGPSLTGPKADQPPVSAQSDGKPEDKPDTKTGARDNPGAAGQSGNKAKGKGDLETGGQAGSQAEGDRGASGKTGSTVEGQKAGKGGKSARLESQQVSKVKSHFSQNKPRVKTIAKNEVSVSIGIAVPGTIALYDLPPDVIVVGGPCPIRYFVWGDDIVLVDSCTREVVEIIVGVA